MITKTGDVPLDFFTDSSNTLHSLHYYDDHAVWSGCLDSTDLLPAGSTINLPIEGNKNHIIGSFVLRRGFWR